MDPFVITEEVPFSLFDLHYIIIDVKKYPEFLPWFKSIEILNNTKNDTASNCVNGCMRADVKIGFGFIKASYICDIYHELIFEKDDLSKALKSKIIVTSDSRIFEKMNSIWELNFINHKTTMVKFSTYSLFKSKVLSKLLSRRMHKKSLEIITRFKERAENIIRTKCDK